MLLLFFQSITIQNRCNRRFFHAAQKKMPPLTGRAGALSCKKEVDTENTAAGAKQRAHVRHGSRRRTTPNVGALLDYGCYVHCVRGALCGLGTMLLRPIGASAAAAAITVLRFGRAADPPGTHRDVDLSTGKPPGSKGAPPAPQTQAAGQSGGFCCIWPPAARRPRRGAGARVPGGYYRGGSCTTYIPCLCAWRIQSAVPRPPGNANKTAFPAAAAAVHMASFLIGPAARPCCAQSARNMRASGRNVRTMASNPVGQSPTNICALSVAYAARMCRTTNASLKFRPPLNTSVFIVSTSCSQIAPL